MVMGPDRDSGKFLGVLLLLLNVDIVTVLAVIALKGALVAHSMRY